MFVRRVVVADQVDLLVAIHLGLNKIIPGLDIDVPGRPNVPATVMRPAGASVAIRVTAAARLRKFLG